MLDMGFSEDIREILSCLPESKQTMLFSATFPDDIELLSKGLQKDATFIKAQSEKVNKDIEQSFYKTQPTDREKLLLDVLATHCPESTIVFCTTKIQCDQVANFLQKNKVEALALHGGLEQYDRDEVMVLFAHKSLSVIVATDVAARGIDVKNLDLVLSLIHI